MTVEEILNYLRKIASSTNAGKAMMEYESEGYIFRISVTKTNNKETKENK